MLRFEGVGFAYDQGLTTARRALSGVDLVVGEKDRLGLCGPPGAGKSTLLLLAAGLYTASAGRVYRRPGLRAGLALQEPEAALFARTVGEELAFAPRQQGLAPREVEAVLHQVLAGVGLPAEILSADPFQLPPSQRRMVAVAAVLAGRPDLLLLDEPSAGLENAAREQLLGLVGRFPGAVVIASHDLDLLWRTCERVAVLDRGRLACTAAWDWLVRRPEMLSGYGQQLPAPLKVVSGLIRRGWAIGDPGHDEEGAAAAILRGAPRPAVRAGEGDEG